MQDNMTNFASSTLSAAITTTTALSLTLTTGGGALYPTTNFLVTIDSEILFIASRSADTFTVATGGRGYDGTTAATHVSGATVQCDICAYHFKHLWQNTADTIRGEVPPIQLGATPSSYDNEFEVTGSWVLTPAASGSSLFSVNTNLRSCLLLNRVGSDATAYTAYIAFPIGSSTAFTATCKLSDSILLTHTSSNDEAQTHFFASDSTVPTSSDSGNRFKMNVVNGNQANPSISNYFSGNNRRARVNYDISSVSHLSGEVVLAPSYPIYLRLTYDGAGTWCGYVGDGLTYYLIYTRSSFSINIQTLGFSFTQYIPSGTAIPHTAVIDFVRVALGSALPPFASSTLGL